MALLVHWSIALILTKHMRNYQCSLKIKKNQKRSKKIAAQAGASLPKRTAANGVLASLPPAYSVGPMVYTFFSILHCSFTRVIMLTSASRTHLRGS